MRMRHEDTNMNGSELKDGHHDEIDDFDFDEEATPMSEGNSLLYYGDAALEDMLDTIDRLQRTRRFLGLAVACLLIMVAVQQVTFTYLLAQP